MAGLPDPLQTRGIAEAIFWISRLSCASVQRLASPLLCLALAAGCGPHARRHAEYAAAASLAGVLGTSLVIAAAPGTKPTSIGVAIGFGAAAVGSTIAYAIAASTEPPPPPAPPPPSDHRGEAWALTQQAQSAARANDCATVEKLSAQVAALDPDFHTVVFARDTAIARCRRP